MYRGGGVQNQAEKNSKNAFRPVPVQKFTFPALKPWKNQRKRTNNQGNSLLKLTKEFRKPRKGRTGQGLALLGPRGVVRQHVF